MPPDARRVTLWIVGGLIVWGTILAIGAFLYNKNPWRLALVLGCVLAFLAFWGLLLGTRRWSLAKRTALWSVFGGGLAAGMLYAALELNVRLAAAPFVVRAPIYVLAGVAGLILLGIVSHLCYRASTGWRSR